MNKIKQFIISVAISLSIGGLSAILTRQSMSVYSSLNRPALAPPAIAFPIVWTILFFLMGISAYLVYREQNSEYRTSALFIYGVQLIVNFIWPLIFFNSQKFLLAFFWLIILWLLVLIMIILFHKVKPSAAFLQIPYILWLTFAGYLNFMVYLLNK